MSVEVVQIFDILINTIASSAKIDIYYFLSIRLVNLIYIHQEKVVCNVELVVNCWYIILSNANLRTWRMCSVLTQLG